MAVTPVGVRHIAVDLLQQKVHKLQDDNKLLRAEVRILTHSCPPFQNLLSERLTSDSKCWNGGQKWVNKVLTNLSYVIEKYIG